MRQQSFRFNLAVLTVVVILGLLVSGCATGVRVLGQAPIDSVSYVKAIQVKTEGADGTDLTVVLTFACHDKTDLCGPLSQHSAGSPALWKAIMEGFAGRAAIAGSIIGTGALLSGADISPALTVETPAMELPK